MAFDDAHRWRGIATISVLARVADDQVPALRAHLAGCEPELRLGDVAAVHFLRIFIIEPARDLRGRELPARLVLSVVFDGDTESLLSDWVGRAGAALVRLLGHCVDGPTTPADVTPFLIAHAVVPNTFHVGAVRSSIAQIREEERLAVALRGFVDQYAPDPHGAVDAAKLREDALAFVRQQPHLPQLPRPGRTFTSSCLQRVDLARAAVLVITAPLGAAVGIAAVTRSRWRGFVAAFAGTSAVIVGAGVTLVRVLELTEPDVVVPQDDDTVRMLEEREDIFCQNQFTMVAAVRGSFARRQLLRMTLYLSDVFSKHFSRSGKLVGVDTIHFARIHRIDDGHRFLFMSDFDGGWNRYLFDFLTTGAFAVVPNWTNLVGCPKTKLLLQPGPGFAQRFVPFTRARQVLTDVWYSAAPDVTVGDVLRHADIRAGLFSTGGNDDAKNWLRKL
jgi:hypothetical protein